MEQGWPGLAQYTPATPANWATRPRTVQDALDLLAARSATALASAELVLGANATATVMTNQNQFYAVATGAGWNHDIVPIGASLTPATGAITINTPGRFWTIVSLAFTSGAAPQVIAF